MECFPKGRNRNEAMVDLGDGGGERVGGCVDAIEDAVEASSAGPDIHFKTMFPKPGVYKLFTQFQHEGNVQTVEYVLAVTGK